MKATSFTKDHTNSKLLLLFFVYISAIGFEPVLKHLKYTSYFLNVIKLLLQFTIPKYKIKVQLLQLDKVSEFGLTY